MLYEELINRYGYNTPIFSKEILRIFDNYTKAYVYQLIDKEIVNNRLKKYSQGVYFIPQKTILDETTITSRDVVCF